MNVIDMSREIDFITDLMFPIPSLPDTPFMLGLAAGTNTLALCQPSRESGLDERPAQWIVGIVRWQALHRVKMFG